MKNTGGSSPNTENEAETSSLITGLFLAAVASAAAVVGVRRLRRRSVHVQIEVNPADIDRFISATLEHVAASREEPGVLQFDPYQCRTERTMFVLHEIYRSRRAEEDHRRTFHYQQWRATVEPWMALPRRRVTMDATTLAKQYRKLS